MLSIVPGQYCIRTGLTDHIPTHELSLRADISQVSMICMIYSRSYCPVRAADLEGAVRVFWVGSVLHRFRVNYNNNDTDVFDPDATDRDWCDVCNL